jgi:hypothetical protein
MILLGDEMDSWPHHRATTTSTFRPWKEMTVTSIDFIFLNPLLVQIFSAKIMYSDFIAFMSTVVASLSSTSLSATGESKLFHTITLSLSRHAPTYPLRMRRQPTRGWQIHVLFCYMSGQDISRAQQTIKRVCSVTPETVPHYLYKGRYL